MIKLLLTGVALFMLSAAGVKAQHKDAVKLPGNITAVKDGMVRIPVVLDNIDAAGAGDIMVTVDIDGKKQTVKVSPDMIVNNGSETVAYVSVKSPSATGVSEVMVTADGKNGGAAGASAAYSLTTVSRKVPHKVVIEDYTAFWCPTCPIGFVGIERSKILYGDDILVLAAHFQDPLSCKDYDDVTRLHMTLPRATVDRDPNIGDVNPYLGSERGDNGAKYGLGFDIEEQRAIDPVVDVKVGGGIEGNKITVTSEITALYSGAANLGVTYVITQDSLSHPNWKQQNSLPFYYRDHPIIEQEPLFEQWFNGDLEITGLAYSDVVRTAGYALNGKDGVIPAEVKEEEIYTDEEVFDLDKYVKIKNTDYMNLCVFVIDRTSGKIVNSASVKLSDCNAIEGVWNDSGNVVETARYTVDGQLISVPERGINIVKFSDGSVRKELVR